MKKFFLLCAFFAAALCAQAQTVNDYKYVVVPTQFSFLKKPDQYQLNTMTKSLLEKYGFVVYFDDEQLPMELRNLNCSKLFADLLENGGTFTTKLKIVLKDCSGKILFESQEGSTREKDFKLAYHIALRAAAKSFDDLQYQYSGKGYELGQMPAQSAPVAAAQKPAVTNVAPAAQTQVVAAANAGSVTLFAQPIANGFQLIDSTPKVVMKIFNTGAAEVFQAEKGNLHGTLRKANTVWVFEYYENGVLKTENLSIKF